jgi:beta-fructofuranosidase
VRPTLHFTPRTGWINDPCGLTWHEGRYHLFFQHVPGSTTWQHRQHWGHAVSDDLVTWTERPVAIAPGDGDDGIWSGTVVEDRLFSTSTVEADGGLGRVRVACADDASWDTWTKGPVLVSTQPGLVVSQLRDPFVLRQGDLWRMVLGAGTGTGVPMVLTWTSPDLEQWTYDGVLASGADVHDLWPGEAWECPQLFELDGSWVLVVSVWTPDGTHHEVYGVGDLVDGQLVTRSWHRLTYGPAPYAGSAFVDAEGRRCLVHWLRGVADEDAGWAGAHSVPHVLRVEGDRLVAAPHPAVESEVEELTGDREVGDASLAIRDGVLTVEPGGGDETFTVPCGAGPVRLLVDGPVVEVFTPEGVAGFTVRPTTPSDPGVEVFRR